MRSSFFSSDAFLSAATAAFYPGRRWQPREVQIGGSVFRVAVVGRRTVMHDCRFLDYLSPLREEASASRRARFLRRTCLDVVPFADFEDCPPGTQAAPFIRWGNFADFDAFREAVRARSKSCFPKAERMARKLEREVGPLRFVESTNDAAALRALFEWKSEQFRRTELPDLMASAATRTLFENLLAAGAVQLSALYAGDRLAALHLGPRHGGRFYHWIPAYEAELGRYAPGATLNHQLMRWSYDAGDDVFDLLLGDEAYKWRYATDVAIIGPRGTPPLRDRAVSLARDVGRRVVRRAPRTERALREVMRRIRQRG